MWQDAGARIRLKDGLRVEQDGVVASVRGQCARILVLLALDQPRHDEAVVELLWPGAPNEKEAPSDGKWVEYVYDGLDRMVRRTTPTGKPEESQR